MDNKRKWLIFAGLVVLAVAFLLLNFRAASSATNATMNSVTTSSGEHLPPAMQGKEKITLQVTGEGPLAGALRKTLAEQLRGAGLGQVEVAQERAAAYPNPVLLVEVGQASVIWTPFYATSQIAVKMGYASNGGTNFMSKEPIAYDTVDSPSLNLFSEYQVTDRSWGILSRPGYYQVLADYLAKTIIESTRKLYEPKL